MAFNWPWDAACSASNMSRHIMSESYVITLSICKYFFYTKIYPQKYVYIYICVYIIYICVYIIYIIYIYIYIYMDASTFYWWISPMPKKNAKTPSARSERIRADPPWEWTSLSSGHPSHPKKWWWKPSTNGSLIWFYGNEWEFTVGNF